MTSLMLFKYKEESIFDNIVFVACFDSILLVPGVDFTMWVSNFDAYFERMFVRCDCTA